MRSFSAFLHRVFCLRAKGTRLSCLSKGCRLTVVTKLYFVCWKLSCHITLKLYPLLHSSCSQTLRFIKNIFVTSHLKCLWAWERSFHHYFLYLHRKPKRAKFESNSKFIWARRSAAWRWISKVSDFSSKSFWEFISFLSRISFFHSNLYHFLPQPKDAIHSRGTHIKC